MKALNPIRILDLFRMTAGMSYDTESAAIREFVKQSTKEDTMRQAMAALSRMPLLYEPGTRWVYSLAHDVLGGLVERVSGEKFSEYLQNHIFKPLDIIDMYFTLTKDQQPRLSAQYAADFDTHEIRPVPQGNRYRFTDTYESGGAGLICTVDAYARFVEALANGGVGRTGKRILTMESINELRCNRLDDRMLADFASTGKTGYGYGLGVRTLMDAGASKSPVGEFGWDGAAGAFALIDTENKLGIFFAEHVLGLIENYHVIHPMIRDLAYEAVLG
jgi:CubicO group peptidase (beta-lactamase class C family)